MLPVILRSECSPSHVSLIEFVESLSVFNAGNVDNEEGRPGFWQYSAMSLYDFVEEARHRIWL